MSITYALIFIKTNVDTAEPGPGITDVVVNPEPNSNYQSVRFCGELARLNQATITLFLTTIPMYNSGNFRNKARQ